MKKQFVVIGLGRFGTSLARTLVEQDVDVLVIDTDEEKINQAMSYATHAVQADATDEQAMESLGIRNFDVVCVCMAEIQSSVLVAMFCIEQGVPQILAKAGSDVHAKLLKRIGVNRVVFPERDTGIRVALSLIASNILDFIELSPDYGIAEMSVHEKWVGKNLLELDFRQRYGLNIIAIKHSDMDININPLATDILQADDRIVVVGSEDQFSKMDELVQKKR